MNNVGTSWRSSPVAQPTTPANEPLERMRAGASFSASCTTRWRATHWLTDRNAWSTVIPAPYNAIFHGGLPVALIDWDHCHPGNRIDDLGYMAWTWCIQSRGQVPIADQAEHLREMSRGYGEVEPERLLDAVVRQQIRLAEIEAAKREDPGQPRRRRQHAQGAVAWAAADRELVLRHHRLLLSALR